MGSAAKGGRTGRITVSETKVWEHHELGKKLSNWGRWGADDEIGTLNFVTDAKRQQAGQMVKTGKVIDMGMAYDKKGPQDGQFRANPIHTMTFMPIDTKGAPDTMISADDTVTMGLQCATQWDSLAHVGYGGFFYNGMPETAITAGAGAKRNSIDKTITRMVSRGVLLDVAGLKGVDILPESYVITSDDLNACEERQKVKVESGDILCIRTGQYRHFLAGDNKAFNGAESGPGLEVCNWFHEREIAACAIDNWAFEAWPANVVVPGSIIPVHQVTIRDMGLTLGEMFNFEDLAADCNDDGVWEFMFTGAGLKVTGAVGSPLSPLALK
jgi:kynurenine formamidase